MEEQLDEILISLEQYNLGDDPIYDKPFTAEETYIVYKDLLKAKQAITALIQEAEKRQLVWVRDNLKMDMKDWGEVNRRIKKLGGGDGKS